MKILKCVILLCIFSSFTSGQEKSKMTYSINVLDEKGKSVSDKGIVSFERESSRKEVNYMAYPAKNFYSDSGYTYEFKSPINGIWQPENKQLTVIIKRKKNPISMYAKRGPEFLPAVGKEVGYDLMTGDWVKPYGKGKISDLIFCIKINKVNERESTSILSISFSNKGDGLLLFSAPYNKGSRLRSGHLAPEKGYADSLIHTRERSPGQAEKNTRDKNNNYYVRVRTKLDDSGNVISAHYGKIYGDFMKFTHYLNPTPNDRNIEFNPNRNLLKKLNSTERVTAP